MNFHITITKLFNETSNTTDQIIGIRCPFMKNAVNLIVYITLMKYFPESNRQIFRALTTLKTKRRN